LNRSTQTCATRLLCFVEGLAVVVVGGGEIVVGVGVGADWKGDRSFGKDAIGVDGDDGVDGGR
jgi:hypothetical protein